MIHTILVLLFGILVLGPVRPSHAAAQPGAASHEAALNEAALHGADGDRRSEQPDEFTLSAAYPNPFNPQTSFSLTVDVRQEVIVEVFNLLGVRVRQLYRGEMQSGEPREFTFVADDLPSGIYLYRVQGETFLATRQMTLLK